ncbi:hypothetical protein BD779DRAFT_1525611 [Infundibulicybe gibba]|nr:hypothetical protein BD779DRAFT_1525611 [Infundibulicybe gibba]
MGESDEYLWDAKLVCYQAVASLTFLLYETACTFDDEIKYIWTQPRRSLTKWVYLFMRYFALLAQMRLVALFMTISTGNVSTALCRDLYISQAVGGGILMICLQAILTIRVYALYIRSKRVAIASLVLLSCEFIAMPINIRMILPLVDLTQMCLRTITLLDVIMFGVSTLFPQILITILSLVKYVSGRREGWGRSPVIHRLIRDGTFMVAILVLYSAVAAGVGTKINTVFAYIAYHWLLSIIPAIGCRIVINMQHFTGPDPAQPLSVYSSGELTTFISDFIESRGPLATMSAIQSISSRQSIQSAVTAPASMPLHSHLRV